MIGRKVFQSHYLQRQCNCNPEGSLELLERVSPKKVSEWVYEKLNGVCVVVGVEPVMKPLS